MFRIGTFLVAMLAAFSFSAPSWPAQSSGNRFTPDEPQTEESLERLREEAKTGDADALWNLSYELFVQYQDNGDPETIKEAMALATEAARKGNGRAANLLGAIYSLGIGVEQDEEEGARWYARSAELGEPVGMLNHALRLLHKDEESIRQAKQLLEKASEAGLSEADYFRGQLELSRPESERDAKRGVALIRSAAEGGMADAMYTLFGFYESGRFVAQDRAQALVWLKAAAEKDHADAQWELGVRFLRGDGVESDSAQAVTWFQRAAENGSLNGMTSLAVMYATGDGVAQSYAKAYELYSRAATRGSHHAMKNLAVMYYLGQHVERDLIEAKKWADIAAELGNEEAAALQPVIAKDMTEVQKAEARRRAEAWLKEDSGG